MNRSIVLAAFAAFALLGLAACEDKKDGSNPTASASVAASASAAPSATVAASATVSAAPTTTAPPVDPNALPTQADEGQKAAASIDKANYKSELDKLDKEIAK